MNDASNFNEEAGAALEHASFIHLSVFEWEALHRLAAVSGEGVIKTLRTAGTETDQRLAAHEFMARELADLRRRATTPTLTKNKTDIVKLNVSSYSGDGDARLQLNRWFCEIDIVIEARQLPTEFARTQFLLSKLTKEWALGKLVADAACFSTMESLKSDLRLAFELPQDERVQRSTFLSLKQGRMSMLEYIQRARHLVSCITTNPVDMATQVHVFISGLNAGYQRFYLTRKTPDSLEEAFETALREDYSVSASEAFSLVRPPATEPEPMEIDAIQDYRGRRRDNSPTTSTRPALISGRGSRPLRCFRCRKLGHRAAVCRAPAPVLAHVVADVADNTVADPKNGDNHPPVLHAQLFATTSGSDPRLIILSLHVNGAKRPLSALLDSGATNNFVRAESLLVLPADMRVREGLGHMVVKYADGKSWRVPRRSSTFSYEFDGFHGSDDFLVIELSGFFDCVFGIPWPARHQPHIDWFARTVRPRDIDVNAVLASLCGTPNRWPHVAVMDPDSMTPAISEVTDGPSGACEPATCAGLEQVTQDMSDVVEHEFPRPNEQWLSDVGNDVAEYGFPRLEEQRLSNETDVVERGLPQAVEHGFPRVVERKLPEAVDAVESSNPRPDADVVSRRPSSAAMIERGLSSAAMADTPRPVRCRGRRKPRRPRAPSDVFVEPESEVISVLIGDNAETSPRVRNVEVARPPCAAAEITRLPGLSWKHFLRDLKKGEIEQVCMLVAEDAASITAVETDASDHASDARTRPEGAEPKTAREARFAAQSLPATQSLHWFVSLSTSSLTRCQPPFHQTAEFGTRSTSCLVRTTA
ncbi:hypothetical protein P3T76_006662 [Phytophthora citrophthora]|uniref:Retrotransposon gag domain-containing protein n=1 Tax=Phytophthora citrophthora TaxID=4793 RepID=A0AAD9GNX9_9STRA|nr:hypothetical protein P3T76_006662 [Phytophthora citrophthora]